MNKRHIGITIAAALILAMPLSAADWMGRGFYEPDTSFDRVDGFMHQNPDVSPDTATRKVYFSAFGAYYVLTPNHNSATLGSQILPYPTNMHAILGVWKDCNRDGYIGTPEGLFDAYLSVLLTDTSVCPPTPTVDHDDPSFVAVHNDGEWVREFFPIGPDFVAGGPGTEDDQGAEAQNNTNHYNIADESARIWGDWGLPDSETKASCPVNPRPTGTYQSTGGFLRYADCFSNWRATGAWNDAAHTAGQPGLAFDDAEQHRPDKSTSPANVKNPWGQESDASYATAFDCDNPVVHHDDTGMTRGKVDDPTGGDLSESGAFYYNLTDEDYNLFIMGGPTVPSGVNPGGSAAGTVNETGEGAGLAWNIASFGFDFVWGDGETEHEGNCERMEDDDDGGVMSGQIYEVDEAPFEGTTGKRTSSDVYYLWTEGTGSGTFLGDDSDICVENNAAGIEECERPPYYGWPRDLGYTGSQGAALDAESVGTWFGTPGYAVSRNPYVNRDDLQPWGGVYYTAYAYVDAAGLRLDVAGATGTYGSPHCIAHGGTSNTGAFECDGKKWWMNADGNSLADDYSNYARPGASYNLRDIDCFDASPFRGSPVNTGLVGSTQCSR